MNKSISNGEQLLQRWLSAVFLRFGWPGCDTLEGRGTVSAIALVQALLVCRDIPDAVGESRADLDTVQTEVAPVTVPGKSGADKTEGLPGAAVDALPAADAWADIDDELYGWRKQGHDKRLGLK